MGQELAALVKILELGGPAAVAAIAILAWYYERKQNKESHDELMDLAKAQVAAIVRSEAALEALTDAFERWRDR